MSDLSQKLKWREAWLLINHEQQLFHPRFPHNMCGMLLQINAKIRGRSSLCKPPTQEIRIPETRLLSSFPLETLSSDHFVAVVPLRSSDPRLRDQYRIRAGTSARLRSRWLLRLERAGF